MGDHFVAMLTAHSGLVQVVIIILATFVLEDAATVLAAMQASVGALSIELAMLSLYAGIVLGDLGLYGLGAGSVRIHWIARLVPPSRMRQGRDWLDGRVFRVVFISRFIPGMRLPTYTACGFLHAGFARFAMAAIVATLIWTSLLFGLSYKVGAVLMTYLGAWRWLGALGLMAVIVLAGRTVMRLQGSRQ